MRLCPLFLHSFGFSAALVSLACSGTSTGNPVDDGKRGPTLGHFDSHTFRLVDTGDGPCPDERESSVDKLEPERAVLEASLGADASEFIVLMQEEVRLDEFPLPEEPREDDADWAPESDPVYMARATRIAETQACAVASLQADGGSYVHSFLLINAFLAELTVDQAVQLSERMDVRLVEHGQTDEPPPN